MTLTVVLHLAILIWHGLAHKELEIDLSGSQTAFVAVVIFLLPLTGMAFYWRGWRTSGSWIIALSMSGAFFFGVINHFVLSSPDSVMNLPDHPWRHPFTLSADLLAIIELLAAIFAFATLAWNPGKKVPLASAEN